MIKYRFVNRTFLFFTFKILYARSQMFQFLLYWGLIIQYLTKLHTIVCVIWCHDCHPVIILLSHMKLRELTCAIQLKMTIMGLSIKELIFSHHLVRVQWQNLLSISDPPSWSLVTTPKYRPRGLGSYEQLITSSY